MRNKFQLISTDLEMWLIWLKTSSFILENCHLQRIAQLLTHQRNTSEERKKILCELKPEEEL